MRSLALESGDRYRGKVSCAQRPTQKFDRYLFSLDDSRVPRQRYLSTTHHAISGDLVCRPQELLNEAFWDCSQNDWRQDVNKGSDLRFDVLAADEEQ